jgi:hypothetical protein
MSDHTCEFCSKTFFKKSNLVVHQRTARYCLNTRQLDKIDVFICTVCDKSLASKRSLETHTKTCKLKKEKEHDDTKAEINSLKLRIAELEAVNKILLADKEKSQACVEEIAKQPKTTTNNKTTNKVSILTPLDLSQERLKELVEANFTNSHMLEGQKGVARFTVEHVIRNEQGNLQYICTDTARHTFRFKDGDTEIKDIRGKRLSTALAPPVIDKSGRLGLEAIRANPDLFTVYSDTITRIKDMGGDDSEFRGELASMVA